MSDQAVEKLTITKTTYPIGSILERPGKTAKVLGVSIKNNEFKGYHCNITTIAADNTVREQQGLLSVRDLEILPERGGWKLRKVEPVVEAEALDASFPIGRLFEVFDGQSLVETIPVKFDGGITLDMPVEPITDTSTTSQFVKQLRQELSQANQMIQQQAEQIEQLIESQQSAIDMANAADTCAQEIADQVNEIRRSTDLAPAADATIAPVQEICVIRDITQHLFTEKINQGWQQIHMQFMPGEERDTLNVVFVKTMPAPVAKEPRAAVTVKPVGPTVAIMPVQALQTHTDYASIITNRNLTSEQKRDLMNNRLMQVGATVYQSTLATTTQPNRSLSEFINRD